MKLSRNGLLSVLFLSFLFYWPIGGVLAQATKPFVAPSADETPSPPQTKYHLNVYPVPYFDTDPNEGQTYGLMAAFLIKDWQDNLSALIVPVVTYNSHVKVAGTLYIISYLSPDEELDLTFAAGRHVYREGEIYYINQRAFQDRFFLEGGIHYLRDAFGHFWGLGNNTKSSQDTNYTGNSLFIFGDVGYYIIPTFRLALREEFLTMDLEAGIINSLPDTRTVFGPSQGVVNSNNLTHRFSAIYDSRPDGDLSSKGLYSELYFLVSHKRLGSDFNFHGFGLDVRTVFSFHEERFITAIGFFLQKVYGSQIPFYLQSSLGGAYRLKAFGKGRFVDLGKILLSVEERIRIKKFQILNTELHFSIDPFFEVGEVFRNFSSFDLQQLQPVGGVGFRIRIPPRTVGRLDVGIGKEGPIVFVKLDYPF